MRINLKGEKPALYCHNKTQRHAGQEEVRVCLRHAGQCLARRGHLATEVNRLRRCCTFHKELVQGTTYQKIRELTPTANTGQTCDSNSVSAFRACERINFFTDSLKCVQNFFSCGYDTLEPLYALIVAFGKPKCDVGEIDEAYGRCNRLCYIALIHHQY